MKKLVIIFILNYILFFTSFYCQSFLKYSNSNNEKIKNTIGDILRDFDSFKVLKLKEPNEYKETIAKINKNLEELSFLEEKILEDFDELGFTEYERKRTRQTNSDDEIINISDYDYPTPESEEEIAKSKQYTIALVGTSDIHGFALKKNNIHPATNSTYSYGGLEFMASEIKAIQEEWGNRVFWLDGGDQFQGGLETKLSNGDIITDFFNDEGLNSSAIGNHEFDFGQSFLQERLNKSSFNYLAANIENDSHQKEFWNNMKTSRILKVGKAKIGVIGLSTLDTPKTTAGDLTGINFLDYIPSIKSESRKLKNDYGVDIVILVSHVGTRCLNKDLYENKLRYFTSEVEKECDIKDQEMNALINELSVIEEKENYVYLDAVVAGHTHSNTHHFIKGKPVISTVNNGKYFNMAYLRFQVKDESNQSASSTTNLRKSKSDSKLAFIREKTVIEGPIPVCERIFSNNRRCENIDDTDPSVGELRGFKFHEKTITADEGVLEIFKKWEDKLKPYLQVVATTDVRLSKQGNGDSQLGNIFADCYREITNSDFSILNSGGFRTEWTPGNITLIDIYDMSPFGNAIKQFNILGSDVKKLMKTVQPGHARPYYISGLKVMMNSQVNKSEKLKETITVTDVRFPDDSNIDDNTIYSMATLSFLIEKYGDDFSLVKEWLKPDKLTDFGIDREVIQKCLMNKHITKDTSMDKRLIINFSSVKGNYEGIY